MLTNYHTHTDFCDGKNTAEEMVLSAIDLGFDALGFSGHGFTKEDGEFCMQNPLEYIAEIKRLKQKYAKKIQIYVGVEEDSNNNVNRADYEYLIGSTHYVFGNGKYAGVDHGLDVTKNAIKLFDNNPIAYAKNYYERFVGYLMQRKPDIIGHFDLLTKFDEIEPIFLSNSEYNAIAESYLLQALKIQSIFEVNTGAIARGYRTSPYPSINLLHLLKKNDGKIMVNTDCHNKEQLNCHVNQTKALLKDIGFKYTYVLYDNEFKKDWL